MKKQKIIITFSNSGDDTEDLTIKTKNFDSYFEVLGALEIAKQDILRDKFIE